MYIAPNTNIKLLRNVPLEPDYINTLYFAGVTAQYNYFSSMSKYSLTSQSYQRVNKGAIRVNYKAEDVYDCNYLMFQNASFGNKWFYAFITSIDYINNITCDVNYEIDVMQTWLEDMTLTSCLVEREHSLTDAIGDNIVPENLELGEYVFNNYDRFTTDLDYYAIAVAICDTENSAEGAILDGIFSGAKIKVFPNTTNGCVGVNSLIDNYIQKPDAILGIYLVPMASLSHVPSDSGYWITPSDSAHWISFTKTALSPNDTIDYYIPKNKKLFTYPYNFFHIDNANGREINLRYEFFTDQYGTKNLTPQFKMYSNVTMPITTVLRPMNYKGVDLSGGNTEQINCAESIDLTSFPMCSWNADSWKAWVAQNSVPESVSILTKGAGTGMAIGAALASATSLGTGAIIAGAVASVLSTAGGIYTKRYQASIQADICKGSLNNSNVNVSSKCHNFFYGRVSINRQMAEIIDNYFDRFGYATNKVKIPNISSRPHWNYVKTIGSNVNGNIPADDKRKIDNIFNNGVTFWKTPSEVDNYSLNNAPT